MTTFGELRYSNACEPRPRRSGVASGCMALGLGTSRPSSMFLFVAHLYKGLRLFMTDGGSDPLCGACPRTRRTVPFRLSRLAAEGCRLSLEFVQAVEEAVRYCQEAGVVVRE